MKILLDDSEEPQFEMTPMIDMVFLLLIFFMCASHMSVLQNIELSIPTATKAAVPKERPNRFIVNIKANGDLYAGAEPLGKGNTKQLKTLVKEAKNRMPDLRVYLRADKDTQHKEIRKVMAAMAELGIDDFIFGAFIPD